MQDVVLSYDKKVQEAEAKADSCSKDMQNILKEQVQNVESLLTEKHSKELQSVKEEVESVAKEADERLLKAENEANLRLEEFQESMYVRLNEINAESEEKIVEAVKEKEVCSCFVKRMCFVWLVATISDIYLNFFLFSLYKKN